jgi:hypothetical protein
LLAAGSLSALAGRLPDLRDAGSLSCAIQRRNLQETERICRAGRTCALSDLFCPFLDADNGDFVKLGLIMGLAKDVTTTRWQFGWVRH